MKHFILSLLVLCLFAEPAAAEITSGKVYRIVNVAYNRAVCEDYEVNKITTTATIGTDNTSWDQLWEVYEGSSDGTYSFRNVYTGNYMNHQMGRSVQMTTTTEASEFTVATSAYDASAYTITGTWSAHCAATQAYWLVGWDTPESNANAFWLYPVEGVDITTARTEYNTMKTIMNNEDTYNTALQTFFSDYACTELKSNYQSMTDAELREAMASLPAALQDMAVKIKNNSWTAHEKHFRVHDYKPYSDARAWATKNITYAHTNMNNPTGIVANNKSLLYVMVDSDTPDDATLYINGVRGESTQNGTTSGTQLHKGLNILVISGDGTSMYIYYVVKTIDGKTLYRKLSEYPDIKIHIEGGDVYGYYDVGNDSEDDFDWLKGNTTADKFSAVSMIQVKGGFTTWYMHKDDLFAGTNKSEIKKSMQGWDLVVSNEHALSGILHSNADGIYAKIYNGELLKEVTHTWIDGSEADDYYGNYYNNLAMGWSTTDGYYMYGTEYLTHYQAGGTMRGCVSWSNLLAGNTWGLSHEIGHQHQGPICMPATMECSNNLFSNVNYWMHGVKTTEGCSMDSYMARDYDAGKEFMLQDIWSQMRMYYQLFLYYHAAGHNKKFYPNLFKALRDDPMVGHKNQDQITTGTETLMHFITKCCDVAKEDLTDFFRAWGFFVPYEGDIGDYGTYHMKITQEEINECIAAIKAKGYPVNTAIIFIEDRIDANATVTGMAAAGAYTEDGIETTQKKNGSGDYGSVGQYTDYVAGSETTPAGYTVTQGDNEIVISGGTGAMGFLLYDTSGNLIGYTNTGHYTLSESYDGSEIIIKAIGSSGNTQIVEGFDPDEAVIEAFLALCEDAQTTYLDIEDVDNNRPGWYIPSALTQLKQIIADGKAAVAAKDISAVSAAKLSLLTEMETLATAADVKSPIKTGVYYQLENKGYPGWYAYLTSGNVKCIASSAGCDKLWQLCATGNDDEYRILSYDGHYINFVSTSTQVTATATEETSGVTFVAVDNGNGSWFFRGGSQANNGLHCDSGKKLVGWGNSSDPSRWYLIEVSPENYDVEVLGLASGGGVTYDGKSYSDGSVIEGIFFDQDRLSINSVSGYNTMCHIDGNTIYACYGVNKPEDGKVYIPFNLQPDGTYWFLQYREGQILGVVNDIHLASPLIAQAVGSTMAFPGDSKDYDKFRLQFTNGRYLTWVGFSESGAYKDNGTNCYGYASSADALQDKLTDWTHFIFPAQTQANFTAMPFDAVSIYGRRKSSAFSNFNIDLSQSNNFNQADKTQYFNNKLSSAFSLVELTDVDLVSISSVGWATAYVPIQATCSSNVTAYYLSVDNGTLVKTPANVIPANTGVLLKSNDGSAATATFTHSDDTADDVKGNLLTGTFEYGGETFSETSTTYYILANDKTHGLGFYWQKNTGGTSVNCAQGKAVLAVPSALAKDMFSLDDEPTGIAAQQQGIKEQGAGSKAIYNLAGQKVAGNYKGIIISGGKKVYNP